MKRNMVFILISIVTSLTTIVDAATCEWTNGYKDNLWSTAGNWNLGRVPNSTEDANIMFFVSDTDPSHYPSVPHPNCPVLNSGEFTSKSFVMRTSGSYSSLVMSGTGKLIAIGGNSIIGRGNGVKGVLFLSEDANLYVKSLFLGDRGTGEGYLQMSGGSLKLDKGINSGGFCIGGYRGTSGYSGSKGMLNMSGGTVHCKDLYLGGLPDSIGDINMTGGLITNLDAGSSSYQMCIAENATSTAHVQLDGGIIELGGLSSTQGIGLIFGSGNGTMDVNDGVLKLNGNQIAKIQEYISAGKLTAKKSSNIRSFAINYDSEKNVTSITAAQNIDLGRAYAPQVPEPTPFDTNLAWSSGDNKATETFYISTSQALVESRDLSVRRTGISSPVSAYTLYTDGFELDTTYFWAVDTVDTGSVLHSGDLWQFKVMSNIVIDMFDSYADLAALQSVWLAADGLSSLPMLGVYSMQFSYNTAVAPYRDEVSMNLTKYKNWTIKDLEVFRPRIYGQNDNAVVPAYIKVTDSSARTAMVYYTGDTNEFLRSGSWKEFNVVMKDLPIDLNNVSNIAIGFGNGTAPGGSGTVYIDEVSLFRQRCVATMIPDEDLNNDCDLDMLDFAVLANDWLISGETVSAVAATDPNINWWKFDETSGAEAADPIGSQTGTLFNFPSDNSQWISGHSGNALLFDGQNDFVLFTLYAYYYGSPLENGSIAGTTWSCWFKTTSWNSQVLIGGFSTDLGTGGLYDGRGSHALYINREGLLGFYNRGVSRPTPSTVRVNDGLWHHAAVTTKFDIDNKNDKTTLYLDGVKVSDVNSDTEVYNDRGPFTLGVGVNVSVEDSGLNFFDDKPFDGVIDDVRIYGEALSYGQIVSLAGKSSVTDPVDSPADVVNDEVINMLDLKAVVDKWLENFMYPLD